jgi:molybdenum-dependent DNA-binding transcriptional regulator ModE
VDQLKKYATERQREIIETIEQYGTQAKAAKALGISLRSVERVLARAKKAAAKRGHAPDHDMTHTTPEGYKVKGVSTYYDDEGKVRGQWVKTDEDKQARIDSLLERLEAFSWKPAPKIPKKDKAHDKALCTLLTITDFHLGMYAYAKETGDDWDTDIAAKEYLSAIQEMCDGSPNAHIGILNIQGDFLHWDGLDAVTPTSKHVLDADTRFSRLIDMSLDVVMMSVEIMLAKFSQVKVIVCEGNHDLVGSMWIRKAIKKIYMKNPRIEVDDTDFPFYAHLHGSIMLAFHHGHKVKNSNLPALFSSEPRYRKMWGEAEYTYIHTGHYHHTEQMMGEGGGAIVERHPTLSGKDAYAARGGYHSWRAAHAITYHADYGEHRRVTVTPKFKD